MAFTVNRPARLSLNVYRRGRLRLPYGPLSCSPNRAFDAELRPGPFPDRAASLLPGLLAATRTGLPPAGDDELPIRSRPLDNHLLIAGRTGSSIRWRTARIRTPNRQIRSLGPAGNLASSWKGSAG
jgi:hypothetical protein